MILRKLSLLFVFIILVGCNQSDTEPNSTPTEQENTQNEATNNDNSTAESEPIDKGKILAKVNGSPIYEDDLHGRNLDFVINEEIIYQVGLKEGLDNDVKEKVRQYERSLVINETKSKILENAEPAKKISDEEIEEYYQNNKNKYTYIRMHEISFPDVNLGNEIKEKAEKGESLQDIANSYPDVAMTVSDIGFDRSMERNFDNREIGSLSEVIQKPNGTFSVLKIVETKDIPLKTSKKSIRHILEARRKGEMFQNYARTTAQENNIEIEIVE